MVDLSDIVVIDFETTGLSPQYERVIEVGAVRLRAGKITSRFSQLMDPGYDIPPFITELTGISNQMIDGAPSPEMVMGQLKTFIGKRPILAHNAGFDSKFLKAEMERVGVEIANPFLCSLKLARRVLPQLSSHKLGNLADHFSLNLENAHRALDDVVVTAELWVQLIEILAHRLEPVPLSFEILDKYCSLPKARAARFIETCRQQDLH